ncbi:MULTISPECIES: MBL fold metallo-hydrolase [unclassified Rathayibacter]|uniref:MBL fold metallo-hydrolase n=1 Tax=unclassified Rathayibacter TaxID=2609250 RepID=UPI000F4C5A46|nr:MULTISPECIES: MBL fold metallo-hydrolase [unclassified Rathayibacter]ROP57824.1 L-ascorbate metabolism protein UlaG (beta-lactamase superfamily) [Rathayibacter sp. PhB186]ROS56209.1 L-ascorbate metabolism protein UlaG (beta-lactamase superfamily) [Rathayibacter sp. PhB185]
MRLTKLEHATVLVEEAGSRLVLDPGSFTRPVEGSADTVAVVITHEHADHWTAEQLERLRTANPALRILGPAGVAAAAEGFDVETVAEGDVVEVGPFELRFFGSRHAVIHSSIPVIDNVGVLVNGRFYYAGDSFTVPAGVDVEVLAAPSGAPWMKIAESIDYVLELAPRHAFATHERVLSEAGQKLGHDRLSWATREGGGEYHALEPGDVLEL